MSERQPISTAPRDEGIWARDGDGTVGLTHFDDGFWLYEGEVVWFPAEWLPPKTGTQLDTPLPWSAVVRRKLNGE